MLSRLLARVFLTAAFLLATQACLQHQFEHLKQAPAQEQACGACVAFASVGTAAVSQVALHFGSPSAGVAPLAHPSDFTAAFTPLFRSQAPPALL